MSPGRAGGGFTAKIVERPIDVLVPTLCRNREGHPLKAFVQQYTGEHIVDMPISQIR